MIFQARCQRRESSGTDLPAFGVACHFQNVLRVDSQALLHEDILQLFHGSRQLVERTFLRHCSSCRAMQGCRDKIRATNPDSYREQSICVTGGWGTVVHQVFDLRLLVYTFDDEGGGWGLER